MDRQSAEFVVMVVFSMGFFGIVWCVVSVVLGVYGWWKRLVRKEAVLEYCEKYSAQYHSID